MTVAERCRQGRTGISTNQQSLLRACHEPALPESIYCALHRAEAMARVNTVRSDRPRPWPGVVRGSALRRGGAKW